jgi:3-oxoacyl-(acyl-carrier-protein) synthase
MRQSRVLYVQFHGTSSADFDMTESRVDRHESDAQREEPDLRDRTIPAARITTEANN